MNTEDDHFEDGNEGTDASGIPTSETASSPQTSVPSSAGGMNSDMSTMMKLLLEAKATGEQRDQANKVWQFSSDKAAFDNKVALGGLDGKIQGLSEEISSVSKEVGGIKAQCLALDTRMTAMENGVHPPRTRRRERESRQ